MPRTFHKRILDTAVVLSWVFMSVHAFVVPSLAVGATTRASPSFVWCDTSLYAQDPNDNSEGSTRSGGGPLSFLFNPYDSKIPKEIEKEIYEAEAEERDVAKASHTSAETVVAAHPVLPVKK